VRLVAPRVEFMVDEVAPPKALGVSAHNGDTRYKTSDPRWEPVPSVEMDRFLLLELEIVGTALKLKSRQAPNDKIALEALKGADHTFPSEPRAEARINAGSDGLS
jgi:hypothetical protein